MRWASAWLFALASVGCGPNGLLSVSIGPSYSLVPEDDSEAIPTDSVTQHVKAGVLPDTEKGRVAANGEPFDPDSLTAAHPTLGFGSVVQVKHGDNKVNLRVVDRIPPNGEALLMISQHAADKLGIEKGTIEDVDVVVVASTP